MSWVIAHRDPWGRMYYWNGRDFADRANPGMFGPLEQAARFRSADEAERAFRGDYRPDESRCQPVEVLA